MSSAEVDARLRAAAPRLVMACAEVAARLGPNEYPVAYRILVSALTEALGSDGARAALAKAGGK
jgi:hypothetical protein